MFGQQKLLSEFLSGYSTISLDPGFSEIWLRNTEFMNELYEASTGSYEAVIY
jgi:hypothetical protein